MSDARSMLSTRVEPLPRYRRRSGAAGESHHDVWSGVVSPSCSFDPGVLVDGRADS